ncbi:GNAT family N-acetyltransferase [Herbidospora mongoliensis]|uniref:GNAT family N-acetyltransferase n=1 Tax=Herbidospora mongoliensis TaxID=688067 RepID=UPI000AEAF1B6|nr:GNAT family protein [Herbidospora mongoliensis]
MYVIPEVVPAGTMRDQHQPTLRTGDLLLRPFRESGDEPIVMAAFADPDIRLWNLEHEADHARAAHTIARWRARWTLETGASWIVEREGLVVGRVALRAVDLELGVAETAYWTLPEGRGKGATVAAVSEMTRWALDDLGLHRVELRHAVANTASCRVAERTGYALEGTLRSATLHADGWHDMHIHGQVSTRPA